MAVDRVCFVDCQQPVERCPCRQALEVAAAESSLMDFLKNGGKTMDEIQDDLKEPE